LIAWLFPAPDIPVTMMNSISVYCREFTVHRGGEAMLQETSVTSRLRPVRKICMVEAPREGERKEKSEKASIFGAGWKKGS
jgi:hypothetical protein